MDEITPRVYQLSSISGTGLWGGNVFLLASDNLTLVDTGYKGGSTRILKEARRLGYSASDITNIIITHHHADHIGNLAALKEATQAKVIAHPADAPYIDGRLLHPGLARPQWLSKALAPFYRLWAARPVAVDIPVDDGDELPILSGIKVLHTPGHTPGSICLFLQEKRLIIVGDLLANRFRLSLPSKAFTVDIVREIRSIKKVTSLDFDLICFGHGRPLVHKANLAVANFAKRVESKYQKPAQS